MIARIWRGITDADKADAYLAHVRATADPAVLEQPGLIESWTLRRVQGDKCEFQLITLWESVEAMRAWAGEHPEQSVYYDSDDRFLLDMEPLVRVYEVADRKSGPG